MTSAVLRRWRGGPSVALDLGTAWARAQVCGDVVVSTQRTATHFGPYVAPALHGGVVRNVGAAAVVVQKLLGRLPRWGWRGPRVLACVPSDARASERQALENAVAAAGAADVTLLTEPVAAAIGVGAELGGEFVQMLVDVGEGVTDAVVIDRHGIVASAAVRAGCAQLRRDVRTALARRNLRADEEKAERILRLYGVTPERPSAGVPSIGAANVDVEALQVELAPSTAAIATCVGRLFRGLGDREVRQVMECGVVLTGGGALLPGMRALVEDATQVTTRVADDPMHAVIRGASAVLTEAARTGRWPSGELTQPSRAT